MFLLVYSRKKPCHCVACNGRLRDHRTVNHHMKVMGVNNDQTECGNTSHDELDLLIQTNNEELDLCIQTDNEEDIEVHASNVNVHVDKIEAYLVSALKSKLIYGHSQAEIEHQLNDAATFLCPSVPTKWSDVKKMLKKLGYIRPKHYKVCCRLNH